MTDYEYETGRLAGIKWGERQERERIVADIKAYLATWQKTPSMNFRAEIIKPIERIENV